MDAIIQLFNDYVVSAYELIPVGFATGVWGIIIGGSFFFILPILQLQYGLNVGESIGTAKLGSLTRTIALVMKTHKEISWKIVAPMGFVIMAGSFVGVMGINKVLDYAGPVLLFAILVSEFVGFRTKNLKKTAKEQEALKKEEGVILPFEQINQTNKDKFVFYAQIFLLGIYAGFIGAGAGILAVAILRTQYTDDSDIARIKIHARAVELFGIVVALIAHIYHGNVIWVFAIPHAIGAFAGGWTGTNYLKKMVSFSPKVQKGILVASYLFILVAYFFQDQFMALVRMFM